MTNNKEKTWIEEFSGSITAIAVALAILAAVMGVAISNLNREKDNLKEDIETSEQQAKDLYIIGEALAYNTRNDSVNCMYRLIGLMGNLPDNVTVEDLKPAATTYHGCNNSLLAADDFYYLTTSPEEYKEYHEQMVEVMDLSIQWSERDVETMYSYSLELLNDIDDELDKANEIEKDNGMKDRREELLD